MFFLSVLLVGGCATVTGVMEDLVGDAEDVIQDAEDLKEDVEDVQDTIEGLTNPLVAQAFLLDIAPPDFAGVDLEEIEGLEDVAPYGSVILADATEVADIENAPIVGAVVRIRTPNNNAVALEDLEDGTYYGDGTDGLSYESGQEATLTVNIDGVSHQAVVQMPREPDDLDIPLLHTANDNMVVDFDGYAFHQILVVVVDLETLAITYSNEPVSAEELYDFSQDREIKTKYDIPARAFNRETYYAVGIAGVLLSGDDQLEEMNTALSAFMAGKIYFYPVTTLPIGG